LVINEYPVTFSAGANGTLTATVDAKAITTGASIEHGKDVVFTAAPNTGYRVQAWKLDGSILGGETGNSYTLTNLGAAATVTVIFELIPTYTVTYNGNGSTGGTAPTDEGAYQEGANVTVLGEDDPPTQTGYTFAGWNTAADGSGTAYAADDTFTMGTADVTLYAQWTIADFAADENDVFGTTATFTWSAAIGASSIKIQQSTDEGSTWADATTYETLFSDATTAVVIGLTKNTAYQFKLVVDGGTTAGESNSISVTTKAAAMYGASWDSKTNKTTMTRLGDAIEANNPEFVGYFDTYAPWSEMKRCTIDGQVMVKIPKFYYKHTYADGVHQFWVADGPLEAEGFDLHPAFMRAEVEKDCIYMGAYKAGDINDGGIIKLTSVSGAFPAVSRIRETFREQAKNRGDKWCIVDALARNAVALLYLVEYADTNSQATIGQGITGLRYNAADTVTVATTDANEIVVNKDVATHFRVGRIIDVGTSLGGREVCKDRKITGISAPDGANNVTITVDGDSFNTAMGNIIYHVGQKTGGCDGLGNASGSADGSKGNKVSVSYRGLEDLWGNVWEFIDGINIKNKDASGNAEQQPYIADDYSNFADNVFDGVVYTSSGVTLPFDSGFVSDFACSADADWLLMPSAAGETGASSSTYIPDCFYQNWNESTSDKVALVGGRWDDGAAAGLFDWNVGDTSSLAYLTVGARLLQIP
jgi:uncharacterized repeat protein (TIGR02543 family)